MIFQHHGASDDSTHCETTLPSHFPSVVHCQSRLELAKPPPPLGLTELGFEPKFTPGGYEKGGRRGCRRTVLSCGGACWCDVRV
jgi:hypothetical protein